MHTGGITIELWYYKYFGLSSSECTGFEKKET